ncbi:hypothetical protein LG325_07780 [Marinobacter nauticus]
MSILFTLGLYQTRKPERWQSKHKVFFYLSQSLRSLGIDSCFLCNPASVKERFIEGEAEYFFEGEKDLVQLLDEKNVTHLVIWGGRTDADERIREEVGDRVKIIYGEYGWFPQSQHCYFSPNGTNADADLWNEGLAEHKLDCRRFLSARRKLLFSMLGWRGMVSPPEFFQQRFFNVQKKIFVPLQDEQDTNIILSSPVKTMSAFVEGLSFTYPDHEFLVRAHPRAHYESLPELPNVEYQSPAVNPFKSYKEYGGVLGINSTMLLQFALLGLPVAGIGEGVASHSGVYTDLDWYNLPQDISLLGSNPEDAAKALDFILRIKQLSFDELKRPNKIKKTYLHKLFSTEAC